MTRLNEYRHPATDLDDDKLVDVVTEIQSLRSSEVLEPWTDSVLEILVDQIEEAEDGLGR